MITEGPRAVDYEDLEDIDEINPTEDNQMPASGCRIARVKLKNSPNLTVHVLDHPRQLTEAEYRLSVSLDRAREFHQEYEGKITRFLIHIQTDGTESFTAVVAPKGQADLNALFEAASFTSKNIIHC